MILKTSSQLRTSVAGFMQRDPSVFVRGTGIDAVDLLYLVMNNARLYAERLVDLELSRREVQFANVSLTDGVFMGQATLKGTDIPVRVKKIITPWLPLADGNYYPIDLWTKRAWSEKLKRRFESARPTDTSDYAEMTEAPFVLIQNGTKLFVAPADATAFPSNTFTLMADAFVWLPDYVEGNENDFLLDNCFDWMLFYCVSQLNFFLKEDERVQLSASLLKDTWEALVKWNNELMIANTDDTNLD